ncbi:lipase maturation factor 1 [Echinops telfairi]|uniref:Lipase maturation factor 1 n=1 Tax=Echinops telfairi TaxID=9371 RepID=A0AC55CR44_ECHTE|nr:lipase maturation factor 1 [Echinops telfairi]
MRPDGPTMATPAESLRKRRRGDADNGPDSPSPPAREPAGCLRAGTFWLTRVVLLRALAFVYCVAFLVAFQQNKQLIGDRGLLPCRLYLQRVQQHFKGRLGWDALSTTPTLLWFMDWSHMDTNLDLLALAGLGLSSFILVAGCANMVLMATLWALYLSLVNVGQIWYAFGWESQLLETGFLGIFLCPLWTLSRLPRHTPVSRIVIWGFQWLIFRIMLGAGLIKVRGDQCWRDLTCMDYHYETQPVPNPMAYYLHRSPWWVHRVETFGNHVIELLVPFFLVLGRRLCLLHGLLQGLFQVSAPRATLGPHAMFVCLMHVRVSEDLRAVFVTHWPASPLPSTQTYEEHEWVIHLAGKLLTNDAQALSLLAHNPFEGRAPPRWVRAEHYRYKFSRPGGLHANQGEWWVRKRIGPYFPPLSLRDLKGYFEAREWPHPELA